MQVVFINPGHDTAGAGIAFKSAFDAVAPDWQARAICRSTTYLNYPLDILWRPDGRKKRYQMVNEVVEASDVVHAMNSPRPLGWFKFRDSQRLVVHHLGTTFRRDPEGQSAQCREYGAIEVTDSVDLLLGPHIGFLPIPADLDTLRGIREAHYEPSAYIRIAHAPTDREYKDTEAIMAAVDSLGRRYPIKFDLIEKVTNRECLRRKARADIFVDQLKYGFGLNAIECWAMGIPVVSGFADSVAVQTSRVLFGQLPWANATPKTLESVIEHLVVDEVWRSRLGKRGRAHAERWHSQAAVVKMATGFYGVRDDRLLTA